MGADVYVSFGADTGGLEAAFALTKAEVKSLSAEMTKLANEMQKSGAAADSELGQHLRQLAGELSHAKGEMSDLSGEMRKHRAEADSAAEGIAVLRESFRTMLEIAGVAIGIDAFKEMISAAFEAGEKIERTAAMLGATTTQVQLLGATARMVGGDADQMALQMERLQLQLTKVESKSSPAAAALKALGVNAEEFRHQMPFDQIETLAEAFSRFADGPTKTAAAMALLGRAGAQMIPYLDRGKEGLDELKKSAIETGAILSDADVKAMAEAAEASNKLGVATDGLKAKLVLALQPGLQGTIDLLNQLAGAFSRAAGASSGGWAPFWWFRKIDPNAVPDIGGGNLVDQAIAAQGHDRNLGAGFGAPKPQVPEFNTGSGSSKDSTAAEARQEITQAFDTSVQDAREAAQDVTQSLNSMVKGHVISWQEWTAASKTALDQEAADVQAAAQKALSSAGLTSAEKIAIARREEEILHQIHREEVSDEEKAQNEIAAGWRKMFDGVFRDFNSAFQGMLTGHETFRSAMVKVFDDIAMHAAESFEHMVASAASGLAAQKGINLSSITGDAGRAAAGAYAALAGIPIIGPVIAPIGAATAFAGTMAFASADIGMWDVPQDQLSLVHQNELIMPASEAGAFRSMLSSGAQGGGGGGRGVTVHAPVSVSGMDTASIAAALMNHGSAITKALDRAIRHGAARGLKTSAT